jgi:hypothetical protein
MQPLTICAPPILAPIQFVFQGSHDVMKLPCQIGVVKSRLAAGCEQADQFAFNCALAQFVDHDPKAHHAI